MAQTMLYVNEHLHDQLYDGAVDPSWIRSFAPGDYLVVETADGDLVTISGHPAERGTFELFVAAFGLDELAASSAFATVQARLANFGELARAHRCGGSRLRRRRGVGGAAGAAPPRRRQGARRPRARRVGMGERTARRSPPSPTAATGRSASPTRRGASTTCRRDHRRAALPRRGQPRRARRPARLRRRPHRRAGGVRRPVEPPPSAAERVPPQQGGTLEPGTLESGTLAIGTLLPRRAAARDAAAARAPHVHRRLQHLVDDVDRRVGGRDPGTGDPRFATVEHEHSPSSVTATVPLSESTARPRPARRATAPGQRRRGRRGSSRAGHCRRGSSRRRSSGCG